MEFEKDYENSNLERRRIIYPAYQTTNRFHNLYSDVRTWVRELIQNADDADAETIQFNIDINKSLVEVTNDGHPFNSNDIERLLTPCLGGKDLDKTGAMNLGALSVLSISDQPLYHSGNTLLKFEMNHDKEDFIPFLNEKYESHFNGTRVLLPFHSRLSKDDLKKLGAIDDYITRHTHLLFTQNLKKIILKYPNKELNITRQEGSEDLFKRNRADASLKIINITEEHTKNRNNRIKSNKWLVARRNTVIPNKYFSKKELEQYHGVAIKYPIYAAFNLEEDLPKRVDYPIYIIFPSDSQSGLGFVLSTNFRPETSRKGFSTEGIDGRMNNFLLKKSSELIELVLINFKDEISSYPVKKRELFFQALLTTLYYRDTYSSLESYIKQYIYSRIVEFIKNNILDQNGNWNKSTKVAIVESELWPFFKTKYNFITPPENLDTLSLLKEIGVIELNADDLINSLISGEIKKVDELLKIWNYLALNQNKLSKDMMEKIINNNTILNRLGKLAQPGSLLIPDIEAAGLYNPNQEINSEFIKNDSVTTFIKYLGVKKIKPKDIIDYFVSIKSRLSIKNFDLIKKYYLYFYKYGLFDKKREIVLTNYGFKNPDEAFFNRVAITNVIKAKIPLVPKKIESTQICKLYLENLGVPKEITAKFAIKHVKKYGSRVVSIDLLKFISLHVNELSSRDLKGLEEMELIPTTSNKFVKPSKCYFLTERNKKILGNLVDYFDSKEESNKEWLKFFKKIGICKKPKIEHLRLALKEALKTYKSLEKSNDNNDDIGALLERFELIFESIAKSEQKEEKKDFIYSLSKINCIPSTKGIDRPIDIYLNENRILNLLGQSVPYPLIKIPDKLIDKLGISKKPIPQDVANYLINELIKKKSFNNISETPIKTFDKIYSYLGKGDNFYQLNMSTKKTLLNKPIIYLPGYDCFEIGSRLIIYSREAEMIYGNTRNLIKYSDYPNSLNFFKKVGIKTSINSDDIADFLVEYANLGEIDTQRLFMLYNIIGQRFRFLSVKKRLKLKNSKIILSQKLKDFDFPENVFIPDEKLYVEKFPSIKTAIINDKIIDFLELVGVKKISDVIIKNVVFTGGFIENEYSKMVFQKIKELIPYIDVIAKDGTIALDKDWKRRLNKIKCVMCDQIYYELQFKAEKTRIQGKSVEYDSKNKIIGIAKEITKEIKFSLHLSKTVSSVIFIGNVQNAKLMSPLIEKLLQTDNKIQTLKELGFSTFKLEAKKIETPKIRLSLPKIAETYESLSKELNSIAHPKDRRVHRRVPYIWSPKKFNVIKKNYLQDSKNRNLVPEKDLTVKGMENINIILKMPPSQNQIVNYIKNGLNKTLDSGSVSNFEISSQTKRILNKFNRQQYKSMEFPGRAEYGGLDITPPIPKLILEEENGFNYYKQEGLEITFSYNILNKFHKMMQYIIEIMEGNPDTVSVAVFESPVNAFNFKGQLIFNYLLMQDDFIEAPLVLIWLFIAAHELAHNISTSHDQLHSKYMIIFAIRAIQKLQNITKKYIEIFK